MNRVARCDVATDIALVIEVKKRMRGSEQESSSTVDQPSTR
jgi:hypothetical protein